jgi:hypothetical protein
LNKKHLPAHKHALHPWRQRLLAGTSLIRLITLSIFMFLLLAQVNTTHAALVVIDNFNGFHLGTRTVTLSNNDGLSPMPILEETGGQAIMRLHSQGNSGNLIRFTYSNFGVYDFTDGGTNEQLHFEFERVLNSAGGTQGPRVQVSLNTEYGNLISSGVGIGLYENEVIMAYPFTAFQGDLNGLTAVTGVTIEFHSHGTQSDFYNEITANRIRATPLGGSEPLPPAASIALASGQTNPTSAQPVNFEVTFTNDVVGFDNDAVEISGTAGATTTVITGGPRVYNVEVSGAPDFGTIQLHVLANSVQDHWEQWNPNGAASPVVNYGNPPSLNNSPTNTGMVGTAVNFAYDVSGTPPISFSVSAGALPNGLSLSSGGVISGMLTHSGAFTGTIQAQSAYGTDTQNFSITVDCPAMTLSPETISGGQVGESYSQAFSGDGLDALPGGYTYAVTGGALPGGLALDGNSISGTPAASGTFNFTIETSKASSNCATDRAYTLNIAPPDIAISPETLPGGTAGAAYTQTISAAGGTAPYTYTISAGNLPAGMTLSAEGILSGTPTASGSFDFTVQAADSTSPSASDTRAYTLDIAPPTLTLNPESLPSGTSAAVYAQALSVTGGNAPYTYTIIDGALPAGLSLNGDNIEGTPTERGSFPITIQAADSTDPEGTTSRAYTLTINPPDINITPDTVPAGESGVAYPGVTYSAAGGIAPYTFALTGDLPAGLTFDATTASISGTPTQSGSFPITIHATDSTTPAFTQTRDYTLIVDAPNLIVQPETLPDGESGTAYAGVTFSTAGGIAPYTYTITAGNLPAGLALVGDSISGTPTQSGSFPITVQTADSTSPSGTGQRAYTLSIDAPTITLQPDSVPAGEAGVAYAGVTFSAAGGIAPYTYSIIAGNLPAGLALVGDSISGMPTQSGSFSITVQAADSTSPSATVQRDYTVIIGAPSLGINPLTMPAGTVGFEYNQSLTGSGGIAPYTYSIIAGNLPAGLALSAEGVLSGTPVASGSFDFTVQVTDSTDPAASFQHDYTLQIDLPVLTIQPETLPQGTSGHAYNATISATGGVGSYTFALAAGALPDGLTLSTAGVLSGMTLENGSYDITIQTTDTATSAIAQRAYTLTFELPVLGLNPTALPDAIANKAYNQTISGVNGAAPYTFELIGGSPPGGFTFDEATGILSGQSASPGSGTFTIRVEDQTGATAEQVYTLRIVEEQLSADRMPPSVETCQEQNVHEQGVLRSTLPIHEGSGYCRLLVTNGNYQTWRGTETTHAGMIGHQGVLDLGVIHAIDVFSPTGVTRFDAEAVCLRGSGYMIFMAASGSPRVPIEMPTWETPYWPGFTCITLWEPGTVILVERAPERP